MAVADKPTGLSEQVLEAVKNGQTAALEAVRTFVETVDKSLPNHGEGTSKRQEVLDSGLAMAERLVQSQYDFLRNVVGSVGTTLGAAPSLGTSSSKK